MFSTGSTKVCMYYLIKARQKSRKAHIVSFQFPTLSSLIKCYHLHKAA